MTNPGDGTEQPQEHHASDQGAGRAPGRNDDVSPYRGSPVAPAGPSQPPVFTPPPRPPVVLETRVLPRPPGRLATVWSHPLTITAILLLILLLMAALAWVLLRESQAVDAAGTDQTSPTPSPSASIAIPPPTPSPDDTPTASNPAVQPSSGQATGAGSSDLPSFGTSSVPTLANGVVRTGLNGYGILVDNHFGEWSTADGYGGHPDGTGSDINFTDTGIAGRGGIQLALLKGVTLPNFDTCKSQQAWTTSLTWSQAPRGAFVCIRTGDGRRGLMRLDEVPELDGLSKAMTQVTGVLWAPIVDR